MKIFVESGEIEDKETDLAVLSFFEGVEFDQFAEKVDAALGGTITSLVNENVFTGKSNQSLLLRICGNIKAKQVLLLGLGRKRDFSLEVVRNVSGKVARQVRELNLSRFVTVVHGEDTGLSLDYLVQAVVEGSELALYTFTQFKTETNNIPKPPEEMIVFLRNSKQVPSVKRCVTIAELTCKAVKLARDIANTPSSNMTPTIVAEMAMKISHDFSLKCTVIDELEMIKLGMGGLLGVSRGSQQPPKMLIMEHQGTRRNISPIILVGKGITFDSGGISIKPSERLDDMKYDKSGAAAVIAVMQAVAELKIPLNIISIIPLTENLPSGSAFKPGDILKHFGGKTSEIISTDAEGRLILADALVYASRYKPKAIIDLATLTGACVIALGTRASGLFSNNKTITKRIIEAGELSGERVWELPLWKEYSEQIQSDVADVKNSGGRFAGAITAAAFLNHFIDQTPWAHLDIAGTAYTQEDDGKTRSSDKSYLSKGATGVGVRLLVQLLRTLSNSS